MSSNEKKLYENIRKIRSARGFSQEYMATKLGVSQKHYSRIERGAVDISWSMICKIADALEVKIHHLIGMEEMLIFHNINQPGNDGHFYAYNATEIDQLIKLYERIISEKDTLISKLEHLLKDKDYLIEILKEKHK
ncbi:MAG: helix-turn-helix transcriptional regulator [Bacteroidia bacterium]